MFYLGSNSDSFVATENSVSKSSSFLYNLLNSLSISINPAAVSSFVATVDFESLKSFVFLALIS
jgi:hypothetical protein